MLVISHPINVLGEDFVYNWTESWGSTDNGYNHNSGAISIAVDSTSNSFYVLGTFTGTVDLDPGIGADIYSSDCLDDYAALAPRGFVSKFNATGDRLWSFAYPCGVSAVSSLAIDQAGNLFVAGVFINPVDFNPGTGEDIISPIGRADTFFLV